MFPLVVWICLLFAVEGARPGEPSSFFLKAPKSVPRAGRSAPGDFESFFLKASKSVPRVGRRNGGAVDNGDSQYQQWLSPEFPLSQGLQSTQYDPNGENILQSYPENDHSNTIPTDSEINKNFYEYMSLFPTHFDKDSLSHRRRPSYDTPFQNDGRQPQENLNKELDEARYQTIV